MGTLLELEVSAEYIVVILRRVGLHACKGKVKTGNKHDAPETISSTYKYH
jgi:hypothetical protein